MNQTSNTMKSNPSGYIRFSFSRNMSGDIIDFMVEEHNDYFSQLVNSTIPSLKNRSLFSLPQIADAINWNDLYECLTSARQGDHFELKTRQNDRLVLDVVFCSALEVSCLFTLQDLSSDEGNCYRNKFNSFLSRYPGGIAIESSTSGIVQINEAFCETMGIDPDHMRIVGTTTSAWINLFPELFTDPNHFLAYVKKIQAQGKVVLGKELGLKSGKTIQVDFIPIQLNEEKVEQLWIYTDISNRKAQEESLRSQADLQRILMDVSSTYINIPLHQLEDAIHKSLKELGKFVGADRTYVFAYDWVNGICKNTHEWCEDGVSPQIDELQALPIETIKIWAGTHKEGKSINIPDVYELPEGHELRIPLEQQEILSLLAIPMMDGSECIGFVGFDSVKEHHTYSAKEESLLSMFSKMLVNVKHRAELERKLIAEKQKAEVANSLKTEFLANMSHEIRTPMNAILGFSEILYNKMEDPQYKKMIESILNSGNLLLALLNDILDLSKIEADKIDLIEQPVDATYVIKEIQTLFFEKTLKKGVSLTVEMSSNFPSGFILDEIRFKQIIFNLVGNAIKFTHKGYVHLNLQFEAIDKEHGELRVQVIDTGIGIPEAQHEIIFDAFRQQSGQSNRDYAGAGLGLSISKRLAEKMNGRIELVSEPGEGSQFTLVLPKVKVFKKLIEQKHPILPIENVLFKGSLIMVVDDVYSNILTVEGLLDEMGLEIIHAESGEAALEILNHTTPDLILLDIRMPGMNGYEVAEKLRANERFNQTALIALTASVTFQTNEPLANNFEGFLYKPTNKYDLVNTLMKHLPYEVSNEEPYEENDKGEELLLNPQLEKKLSEILAILNHDFLPTFKLIKDGMVLFKIEEFGVNLLELAQKYRFDYLEAYAKKLLKLVVEINLQEMTETLHEFPMILFKLQTMIEERNS